MTRLILAGAAALLAFFKPQCSLCNSRLTLNEKCFVCGKEVCGDCGSNTNDEFYYGLPILKEGRYCKSHSKDIETKVNSLKTEIDAARKVTTYSKNFKGKTESPKLSKVIESNYHKDKDVAELELQVLATRGGCVVVQSVEFFRSTQTSDNYTYTVWRATGVI